MLWSFSSTTTTSCVCPCESLTSPGSSSKGLLTAQTCTIVLPTELRGTICCGRSAQQLPHVVFASASPRPRWVLHQQNILTVQTCTNALPTELRGNILWLFSSTTTTCCVCPCESSTSLGSSSVGFFTAQTCTIVLPTELRGKMDAATTYPPGG